MASLPVADARADVAELFLSYLGRAPEFAAMNYYVGQYNTLLAAQGTDPAGLQNAYKALSAVIFNDAINVGELPAGPAVSDEEYVDWIYMNVLGRVADEGGRDFWVAQLGNGSIVRSELVGIVVEAAKGDERDGAYLANRTEVALEFAKFENSNPQILASLQFNAKQVLEGVNETEESVTEAQKKLADATNFGQTFDLTVGADNIVGTSGDDVFNAFPINPVNGNDATTLNSFDSIDGGAGRDTLNIYTSGWSYNTKQQGTVTNVEVINIRNSDSGAVFGNNGVVDASKFVGAEEIWQFAQATQVTKLAAETTAGFADLTKDWVGVVAADAAASATVALKDVTTDDDGELTVQAQGKALTELTVVGNVINGDESEDAELDVTLVLWNQDTKATKLTAKVATEVDATVKLYGNFVALDASASTGDIEYEVDTAVKSVIGGAGNDTFIFNRAIALTDSIDGGEGTDTVVLTNQSAALVTQDYNAINQFKNIEILSFETSGITVDAAQLKSFGTLDFTVLNGTDETDPEDIFDVAGAVTVQNLQADQALSAEGWGVITLTKAAADVDLSVTDENAFISLLIGTLDQNEAKGGTLTVDGEGYFNYSNATGKFATIDVSDLEGVFSLTGMSGSVAETVTLGAESRDFIQLSVATPSSTLNALDTIVGFDATTSATDNVRDYLDGVNVVATVSTAVTSLNAGWAAAAKAYDDLTSVGSQDVVLFKYDGSTYLYAAAASNESGQYNGTDFGIKLVGDFTAAQLNADFLG